MDKVKLLFTDTDSVCYQIQTQDIYEDMVSDQNLFDTADYPEGHFLLSVANTKVILKFKDETASCPIT